MLTRIRSLTAMEVRLLLRNRTTLFYAIALAPLTVLLMWAILPVPAEPAAMGATMVIMLVAIALTLVVYYNLTTTSVARREELMLKRLVTGTSSLSDALVAMAIPALIITAAQLVAGYAVAAALFEVSLPTNVLWLLVGVLGGTVMFALFAYASSAFTRSVESAQLTTMPVLVIVLMASGLFLPLDVFGDSAGPILELTPLAAVVTLLRHGFGLGQSGPGAWDGLADVGLAIAALVIWSALGAYLVRTRMPIEPRR